MNIVTICGGSSSRDSHLRFGATVALATALLIAPATLAAQSVEEGDAPPTPSDAAPTANRDTTAAGTALTEDDGRLRELGLLPGRPVVRPTRTDRPPEIDGRLDDPVWETAARITEFTQQSPRDGAPATEETEVYIAYDSDHIYFGFYAHYEDPSIMRANRVDRDRAAPDDLITVYFDTFLNQQRGYDFDVNGYGVKGDGIINAGGPGGAVPRADRSWDALFDAAGEVVEDGFTAEMAIPVKSLRYPSREEGEPHEWGFQIIREIKSKDQENDVWAPMSRDESSFFAQMGLMEGMTDLSTSRNLEILPTFTAIQHGSIDETVPGFVNQDPDPDAGANVKYGITSNLTADFTLNPDFSQIESDQPQIEVNRRFPLFFQELRPFFIEGAELFEVAAPVRLVHTRTIVDPDYGAKLTGKTGRTSIGLLAANDAAPGRVDDPGDPAFEQKAQTYIGRVMVDLYSESHIGAIVTDREFLDSHSRLAGVDGNLRLGSTRTLNFSATGTRHRDLDGVERDGHLLDARLRQDARHLDWTLFGYQISPDFETETGFVRRTDQRRLAGDVGYRFWPESWIINWGPSVSYMRNLDFDDVIQDEQLGLDLRFSFARNISVNAGYSREMERFEEIDFRKNRYSLRANANTSRSLSFGANLRLGDQIRYTNAPFLGDEVEWGVNATVRPSSRLTSRISFDASRLTDPRNGDEEVFDVKILRARSTFQLSDRLAARNITEFNTFDETLDLNLLLTYRVNAGTAIYLGYDDHYQQARFIEGDLNGDGLDEQLFYEDEMRRTNRAVFMKLQYLFRL